jgi:trehalose 6-phosphate phosphatase
MAALRQLAVHRCLLVFDFDGTLAPIVLQPQDACVPKATAARLRELASRCHVAVITGRRVGDAVDRLGFTPHFLAGNHGAESLHAPQDKPSVMALDACRDHLLEQSEDLRHRGIALEDKGLSLALHSQSAPDRSEALAWLRHFSAGLGPDVLVTWGHHVLNIVPAQAWDKGDALLHFMKTCNASTCLVVGDDVNDEPAFHKAPPSSVTVRIAPTDTPTAARFSMASQPLMDQLLDVLLALHR